MSLNQRFDDSDSGWKLDRRISIPDIVGVIGAGVAVILSYTTLDKRLSVVESMTLTRQEDVRQIKQDVEYIRRLLEQRNGTVRQP